MADHGLVNRGFSKEPDSNSWPEEDRDHVMALSKNGTIAETALDVDNDSPPGGAADGKKFSAEEEKILEVLREVVRKCTNSDPTKRPTAAEVLDMLNKCPVAVK